MSPHVLPDEVTGTLTRTGPYCECRRKWLPVMVMWEMKYSPLFPSTQYRV